MQKKPTQLYLGLGGTLRFLLDANVGMQIHGEGWVLKSAENLGSRLNALSLPVSARAIATTGLQTLIDEFEALPKEAKLDNEHKKRLNTSMLSLSAAVRAEAQGVYAYVVSGKRIDVEKLLDEPAALFSDGAFGRLPDIARSDFASAGRCIAFELPTAAAFHLLRGTEDLLRSYYVAVIRRNRSKDPTWGRMIIDLRAKRTNPPPSALLDHLDSIRINFRNPTQHPELIYTVDEAQNLFLVCIDVAERVVGAWPSK